MQAMDIDAPVITVELGGRAYELRFDNEQIRRTELCYSAATGVRMGYLGILTQAHQKIFGALCALCWGAIASAEIRDHVPGRQRIAFAEFDAHVTYREMLEQADDIVNAAVAAIEAGKGGQGKNA